MDQAPLASNVLADSGCLIQTNNPRKWQSFPPIIKKYFLTLTGYPLKLYQQKAPQVSSENARKTSCRGLEISKWAFSADGLITGEDWIGKQENYS